MKKFVRDWYVTIIPIVIMVALSLYIAYLVLHVSGALGV